MRKAVRMYRSLSSTALLVCGWAGVSVFCLLKRNRARAVLREVRKRDTSTCRVSLRLGRWGS